MSRASRLIGYYMATYVGSFVYVSRVPSASGGIGIKDIQMARTQSTCHKDIGSLQKRIPACETSRSCQISEYVHRGYPLEVQDTMCHGKLAQQARRIDQRNYYSQIGPPKRTHKKSICQQTKRATTNPRPPLESFWQGASIGGVSIFISSFFGK